MSAAPASCSPGCDIATLRIRGIHGHGPFLKLNNILCPSYTGPHTQLTIWTGLLTLRSLQLKDWITPRAQQRSSIPQLLNGLSWWGIPSTLPSRAFTLNLRAYH